MRTFPALVIAALAAVGGLVRRLFGRKQEG